MKLNRREFLSLAGKSAAGAVIFAACGLPEKELIVQSPVEMPEDLVKGEDQWYATTMGDFPGGDGIIVRIMEGRAKKIEGNPDHPITQGKSNARYDSALQMLYHPDRIKEPLSRYSKGGNLNGISWTRAIKEFKDDLNTGGNITLVTNPLRGHPGLIASKFASHYGGVHINFDPIEQGILHKTVENIFDQKSLPHLDIGNAKSIMSFGADWLSTWVSPVQYSRFYGSFRSQSDRGYFIHVDPRMSMTAANADLWLPVKPSYEGDLALGIARIIVEEKLTSEINIEAYKKYLSPGFLNGYQLRDVSHRTGLPEEKIKKAAHIISEKTPAIVFGGGSTEAHTNGSFNLRAVYGLNILLGSVGVTGGVLPNPSSEIDDLPASSSGASMKEWEEELSHWRAGNVDTVIIRGVDLAHGLPNFLGVAEAINNVKNVIVFSTFEDDTTELADLVLPDSTFLESWGTDIPEPAPGYPVLSMQQPVVVSNSRGFADVLLEVSEGVIGSTQERMIESTIRTLQNTDTGSVRASDWMLYRKGVQQRGGWWNTNYSGNISGSYRESSKTGEVSTFSKTNSLGEGTEFHLIPFVSNSLLNGQLAPTPWAQQNPDPMSTVAWVTWAELNNSEADELNIDEGDILLIKSTSGEIEALAYPHPGVQPGTICIPTGQGNSKKGRYAENRGSNVFAILADKKDSETGALAWAATKVVVQRSGRNKKVAKFEGTVEARPIEPGVPVLVLGPGETADEAITANHHIYQNQFLNNSHADTGISHKDDETKTDH